MKNTLLALKLKMKRLPELCGFIESANTPESRKIILDKVTQELDEIHVLVNNIKELNCG